MKRRYTYAYNSFIFGFLFGFLGYAKWGAAAGIIIGIVVTVAGFFIIKAIENVLYKGGEAASQAIKTAIDNKKAEKTQNAQNTAASTEGKICPQCGAKQNADSAFCRNCGTKLN